MTKRSGRSRRSKRRSSGTETSAASESAPITPEVTDAETAEARLRAEAERRADEALIKITHEDAKVDEDRRILRENGSLVDGGNSAPNSGDTAASEDTMTTSPETFSSDTPAPKETLGTPKISDAQSDSDFSASSTKQDDTPDSRVSGPEDENSSRGWVKISEKTVTKIVRQAAASVPGTTGYSGGLDVLGRGYPRFDVELDSNADAVSIDAYVAVTWPSPVTRVAETVRTTIFDWIRDMTNIPVVRVNVTVGPIVPGGERVTEAELISFDTAPSLRPVVVTARNLSLDEVQCSGAYENLRKVSLHSGHGDLVPIQISESGHSELRNIEVASGDDLAPISVTEPEDLREISVTGEAAASVFSPIVSSEIDLCPITVPEAQPLKGISVPEALPLKGISIPEPTPLREISATELPTFAVAVPPAPEAISVSVPEAPEPGSVELPRPAPLRKVETPQPRRLRSVHAPDTHRLAQIHAEAPRVSSVKPPRPPRVRPVKRNPLQVDKKPRVDKRAGAVRNSASGNPLTPMPKELRPITVKRTTIIPVHVDPANAKAVLRDE